MPWRPQNSGASASGGASGSNIFQTGNKAGSETGNKKEIKTEADEAVEKAKRLARTIIADIYLYSSTKMEEAIKKNTFYAEFASDIKEGTKLYNGRVSQEVKNKGDFFREAIENFIENKKKTIKI